MIIELGLASEATKGLASPAIPEFQPDGRDCPVGQQFTANIAGVNSCT